MVDLGGLFKRGRSKAKGVADAAPSSARRAADEARRTAGAVGEVLDQRTQGRFGEAVSKGGDVVSGVAGTVTGTAGQARDAFREEREAPVHRPEGYRPDPIDPPEPIGRPEPV